LVGYHPEGEVLTRTYSAALAQPEVGDKAGLLLGHEWDGQDKKGNYQKGFVKKQNERMKE